MTQIYSLTKASSVQINDGTDQALVTTDGFLYNEGFMEYLARVGTLKIFEDSGITAGTTTLYTAGAGKTLYIIAAAISGTINSGFAAAATVTLQTNTTGSAQSILSLQLKNGTGGDQHGDIMLNLQTPIRIDATKTLTLAKSNHYIQTTTVIGYEV